MPIQPINFAKTFTMGKLSLETIHLQSARGALQAIALPTEGGDRFLLDLKQHPDYPFEPRPMGKQAVYQLALEAEGVPESLAKAWAEVMASPPQPASSLVSGLYRYFVSKD